MADAESLHQQRARAESFGAAAADYDHYRPSYPDELIDALLARRPRAVLDVGCGTGKAARLLVARGVDVLGVEIDPKMTAVAQSHGVQVEVAAFEDWDPRGRTFDLITCAQAWHWIDPAIGAAKAAALLRPGGTLALFWNYEEVVGASRAVLDDVYREFAPQLQAEAANKPRDRADDLRRTGAFGAVTTQTFEWQRNLSPQDWVGKVGTQSDHLLLGPARSAALQLRLRAALEAAGGSVQLTGGTYTIWARPRP